MLVLSFEDGLWLVDRPRGIVLESPGEPPLSPVSPVAVDPEAEPFAGVLFVLGLLGPLTLPSLAYSHTSPRFMHRLHDGCSPLHCNFCSGNKGEEKKRRDIQ